MGRAVVVLLAVCATVLALAPAMPALQPIRLDVVVSCLLFGGLLGACALSVAELEEALPLLLLGMLGAAILASALQVLELERVASLPKAALATGAGALFARAFAQGPFLLAVPLLVGGLDLALTLLGGPPAVAWPALIERPDPLLVVLPTVGGELFAGGVGLATFAFLGAMQAWAIGRDLRPRATGQVMVAGLVVALVLEALVGLQIPKTAIVVALFLLVCGDRLRDEARPPPARA